VHLIVYPFQGVAEIGQRGTSEGAFMKRMSACIVPQFLLTKLGAARSERVPEHQD
jgi:hypothetical protein